MIEKDLLELDFSEKETIERKFRVLLKNILPDYRKKIGFEIRYSHERGEYEMILRSLDKNKKPSEYLSTSNLHDIRMFCTEHYMNSPF